MLEELSGGKQVGSTETVITVVNRAAPAAPLIVLYAILIASALDLLGGLTMVTAKYLTDKFLEPWRAKRHAEAFAKAKAEGQAAERRKWVEWNQRRLEAEAGGVPFDEPPPSS